MSQDNKQYFATLPDDKIGAELMKRTDSYYEYTRNSGFYSLWNFSYYKWNQAMVHRGKILKVGNSLEYDLLYVNHYRNIGNHVINLTASQRPVFKCKAVQTDASVQQQTKTADAVVEYYYRDTNYEKAMRRQAEFAWFLTEGFLYRPWNTNKGRIVGYKPNDPNYEDENGPYEDGQLFQFLEDEEPDLENFTAVHEGDITFTALNPMDVIRDWTAYRWEDCDWVIVRTFKNRYLLAKQFPEFADRIMAIPAPDSQRVIRNLASSLDSDFIQYYEFYHKDNDLVPGGRYIPFLTADVILPSSGLPYNEIPLDRMVESDLEGRPFGYSRASDMLPIQSAYDRIRSIIISGQSTLGGQTFVAQEGSNVQYDQLAESLNVMYYGAGYQPPTLLQKLNTPRELFEALEKLYRELLDISGLNETAMGNPSGDVATFRGQALMNQLAVQNLTGFQNAFIRALESSATGMIKTLQVYADAPRFSQIMGRDKSYMLKEWNKSDIKGVNLVIAELGSPAQRTPGYIMEIAEMMLSNGMQIDPNKLFQSIQYNNLDFLTTATNDTEILITQENENMADGQDPVVAPYDRHDQHILDHLQELYNPEVRSDPAAIKRINEHVAKHTQAWQSADPAILLTLGIPPYPQDPPLPPPKVQDTPHVKITEEEQI
jgi:hypothetical protein